MTTKRMPRKGFENQPVYVAWVRDPSGVDRRKLRSIEIDMIMGYKDFVENVGWLQQVVLHVNRFGWGLTPQQMYSEASDVSV